ncbi:MAG: hypothetical protein ABIQ31_16790 [Ferruginibacter sp.]
MQQIVKKYRPFKWMIPTLLAAFIFLGCSNDAPKTEDPKAATVAPADTLKAITDTLPVIDTTATSRPETRKAK